jgi:hypothetical protein
VIRVVANKFVSVFFEWRVGIWKQWNPAIDGVVQQQDGSVAFTARGVEFVDRQFVFAQPRSLRTSQTGRESRSGTRWQKGVLLCASVVAMILSAGRLQITENPSAFDGGKCPVGTADRVLLLAFMVRTDPGIEWSLVGSPSSA